MDGRVFCGVLEGRLSASTVFRDDRCTASLDVQPANPGHVLVVPNAHAGSPQDLPDEDGAAVFRSAQKAAAALYKSGLRGEGVNLRLADGEVAGQEIPYVHLHVISGSEETVSALCSDRVAKTRRTCRSWKRRRDVSGIVITTSTVAPTGM